MFRSFVLLALIGLALAPDWATAFGWRRSRQRCCAPPPCPTYPVIVPVCPTVPCSPETGSAPQEVVLPAPAVPSPNPTLAPKVHVEPPTPAPVKPTTPPKPPSPGIPREGSTGVINTPAETKPAGLAVPTPADPSVDPKPLRVVPETIAPPKAATPAKPTDVPTLPPLVPPVPGANDPAIPPLSIPPTTPAASPRVAKYFAATEPTVDVFPVDGPIPSADAIRTVGFFNHTDRVLQLTVGAATISLPARHSITARVPARFGWSLDDGPEQTAEVPPASPGVEVVFRR